MPIYNYQTGGPRFLALIIDGFLMSIATGLIGWCMTPHLGAFANALLCVLFSAFPVGYDIYMHGRFGQTLGKFFAGVRVIDVRGGRISYKQAAVRNFVPLLMAPVGLWYSISFVTTGEMPDATLYQSAYLTSVTWVLLEMVTMLLNEQRRAVHDFLANTVVIRVR
ncbi:RDD family protein [Polaromonas sp. P5_D5]